MCIRDRYEYAWVSLDQIDKKKSSIVKSKIRAIESLSKDTDEFILACDLDQEGETIGYNILKYACGEKQYIAKRIKFSTLIENDIKIAFSNIQKNIGLLTQKNYQLIGLGLGYTLHRQKK